MHQSRIFWSLGAAFLVMARVGELAAQEAGKPSPLAPPAARLTDAEQRFDEIVRRVRKSDSPRRARFPHASSANGRVAGAASRPRERMCTQLPSKREGNSRRGRFPGNGRTAVRVRQRRTLHHAVLSAGQTLQPA